MTYLKNFPLRALTAQLDGKWSLKGKTDEDGLLKSITGYRSPVIVRTASKGEWIDVYIDVTLRSISNGVETTEFSPHDTFSIADDSHTVAFFQMYIGDIPVNDPRAAAVPGSSQEDVELAIKHINEKFAEMSKEVKSPIRSNGDGGTHLINALHLVGQYVKDRCPVTSMQIARVSGESTQYENRGYELDVDLLGCYFKASIGIETAPDHSVRVTYSFVLEDERGNELVTRYSNFVDFQGSQNFQLSSTTIDQQMISELDALNMIAPVI